VVTCKLELPPRELFPISWLDGVKANGAEPFILPMEVRPAVVVNVCAELPTRAVLPVSVPGIWNATLEVPSTRPVAINRPDTVALKLELPVRSSLR